MEVVYKKPISDIIYDAIVQALYQNKTIDYIILDDCEAKELYDICEPFLPYKHGATVVYKSKLEQIHGSQYYGVTIKVKSLMGEIGGK